MVIPAREPLAEDHQTASPRLRGSLILLSVTWTSLALFAAYVLVHYGLAIPDRDLSRWNLSLPDLYNPARPLSSASIGVHFLASAAVMVLLPVQLVGSVRRRWPRLHRWLGRVSLAALGLTTAGGLVFIFDQGTVGGPVMNVGFGLYGALLALSVVQTWRHAAGRRYDDHRDWAIRLFALALGAWLYRIENVFFLLLVRGGGHNESYTGPLDVMMSFFFYLPNLLVAEAFIRAGRTSRLRPPSPFATAGMAACAIIVIAGTLFLTLFLWAPAISAAFAV